MESKNVSNNAELVIKSSRLNAKCDIPSKSAKNNKITIVCDTDTILLQCCNLKSLEIKNAKRLRYLTFRTLSISESITTDAELNLKTLKMVESKNVMVYKLFNCITSLENIVIFRVTGMSPSRKLFWSICRKYHIKNIQVGGYQMTKVIVPPLKSLTTLGLKYNKKLTTIYISDSPKLKYIALWNGKNSFTDKNLVKMRNTLKKQYEYVMYATPDLIFLSVEEFLMWLDRKYKDYENLHEQMVQFEKNTRVYKLNNPT